jgi:tetratricopeptide (TPR) repeat protein
LEAVDEALGYYRKAGDEKGEAISLFIAGVVLHLQGDDEKEMALVKMRKAQEYLRDCNEKKAEAQVCRQIAEYQLEKERPEEACRSADDARLLANRAKDKELEVAAFIMVARCHQKVMEKLVSDDDSKSVAFKSEWDKAMKAANSAKTLARKLEQKKLLGEALYTCADVLIIQGRTGDASEALEESLGLLEESGYKTKQVSALVLKGNIAFLKGDHAQASQAANQALALAKTTNDSACVGAAQALVSHLAAEGKAGRAAADESAGEKKDDAAVEAAAVEVVEDTGPKALDAAVVQNTLADVVSELIGADVEDDTPFMDAGLDSLMSIQFRTELQKQFKGLGLSSTITFDYPTPKQLRDHIVEKSQEMVEE